MCAYTASIRGVINKKMMLRVKVHAAVYKWVEEVFL
jgi:hypothetical protein